MRFMKIETRKDIEVVQLLMLATLLVLFLLGAYLTPAERLADAQKAPQADVLVLPAAPAR